MKLQIRLGGYDNDGNWTQEKSEDFHDDNQLLRNTQNRGVNNNKTKVKERNNRDAVNNDLLLDRNVSPATTKKEELSTNTQTRAQHRINTQPVG